MVGDERQSATTGTSGGARSGDFEYDEAHDAVASRATPSAPAHAPVSVATQADDATGGDYAYDLAHDVPRGSTTTPRGTR